MKRKNLLPLVLIIIIAILGGALIYQVNQKRSMAKWHEQFSISFCVQLYQGLESGEVEVVKRRLGGFVAANSTLYEQKYGHETGTKFAPRLEEAKVIKAGFQATSK